MVGTKRPRSVGSIESESSTEIEAQGHADNRPAKTKIKFDVLPDFMQKDPLAVTKEKWMTQSTASIDAEEDESSPSSERRKNEMMAMSAISIVLAVGVVYALASSAPEMVQPNESESAVRDLLREGNAERLEFATRNIVDTVLPQNAEEVIAVSIGEGIAGAIAVSIGEGIAGAIGAVATWLLGMVLNFKSNEDFIVMPVNEAMEGSGLEQTGRYLDTERMMGGQRNVDELVSGAVADGDYFLTRAAAQPLLEALGIPIFFASLASVLIATLPYEAVKLSSQKRRQETEEEILLKMLLEEEENRQRDYSVVDEVSNNIFNFIQRLNVRASMDDEDDDEVFEDEPEISEVQQQLSTVPAFDYVELFADLTKWLEYDVLISNYRGILALPNGQMLSTGWESAIFGLLAALSSQLYTDVLYLYSDFGNPIKREKTINRSLEGWATIYATKCLSTATLFGVYEAVRGPTSRLLSELVSGGVGGCAGSKNVDMCMETYLVDNPPAATFQAEFRALMVSTMNWIDNFSWLVPLNDQETFDSAIRGAAVSL
eukprot:CAMPEP_0181104362 /NCGR_PEP_ID=MMETSP1071-20121207/15383_1 /TAXON_ID=35127 /ORGANISM="Thalassiosira sp., Strain NH16" /LENGTH=543 /DNA_ID=CAMNT_0023187547 /DNA_START=208 /DNA_END=1835 /DNA_ORIENTATION=-